MICPSCKLSTTRVRDSRRGVKTVYRMRECKKCNYEFPTYESEAAQDNDVNDIRNTLIVAELERLKKEVDKLINSLKKPNSNSKETN